MDGGEASGIVAGMDVQDAPEAAEEKARAGEKNDREGDFGDDEEAGEASVAAAEARSRELPSRRFSIWVAIGGLQRGREAEENSGDDGD